jgi:hypothetical protein
MCCNFHLQAIHVSTYAREIGGLCGLFVFAAFSASGGRSANRSQVATAAPAIFVSGAVNRRERAPRGSF